MNYPTLSNINQSLNNANQFFSFEGNNNLTMNNLRNIMSNNYSNSESMFEDVEEEYQNEEAYYPEISYGNNVDEVFNNLTFIINTER
ncbi:MAG: hypothetical protein MJ252_28790 [archaeon]|nr:hypothetical protein [archaeon]